MVVKPWELKPLCSKIDLEKISGLLAECNGAPGELSRYLLETLGSQSLNDQYADVLLLYARDSWYSVCRCGHAAYTHPGLTMCCAAFLDRLNNKCECTQYRDNSLIKCHFSEDELMRWLDAVGDCTTATAAVKRARLALKGGNCSDQMRSVVKRSVLRYFMNVTRLVEGCETRIFRPIDFARSAIEW